MDFLELCRRRYSCRNYSSKPVPDEVIENCLEAARLAPSACNSQPWKFIVIKSAEIRQKVAEAAFSGMYSMNSFAKNAPVLVLVIRDKNKLLPTIGGFIMGTQFSLVDIGIATEHFVLAAAEQGLGTCYIGFFDEKKIKKILGLESNIKIELVISLGYPADSIVCKKVRKHISEISRFI